MSLIYVGVLELILQLLSNVCNVFSFVKTERCSRVLSDMVCVYEHRGMWRIDSIMIFNLINYFIMALVFHIPL